MRGWLLVAGTLALVGCGGDPTGPGDVLRSGSYSLSAAHGTLPGYRPGRTEYTGTLILTAVGEAQVAGSYEIDRKFSPEACGADCAALTSRETGGVTGAWHGGRYELRLAGLDLWVTAGPACDGRRVGDTLDRIVYAPLTACTLAKM